MNRHRSAVPGAVTGPEAAPNTLNCGSPYSFLSLEKRVRKAAFSTACAGSAVGPSGNRAAT